MNDIENSMQKALFKQGWLYSDRWSRIGSPYSYVDGERMGQNSFTPPPYGTLTSLSMYYEKYPTLAAILTEDHDTVFDDLRMMLSNLVGQIVGVDRIANQFDENIECTALTRTQDYCFIKTFCADLPSSPTHIDIGPGLGSHAMYSTKHLNSRYYGIEVFPFFYEVQRQFFNYLNFMGTNYSDIITAETLGATDDEITQLVNSTAPNSITHIPTWQFETLSDNFTDIITATFVLNETSPSAITWLLYNCMRTLKEGGYFYIRDSYKNKPNRHSIKYDEVLVELGFELAGELKVTNRVDMFGIPRVYQKTKSATIGFEELFDRFFGRLAVTVHQGEYMQNVDK